MNCKQGELAFIVNGGGEYPPFPENVGRVVRCERLAEGYGTPVWWVRSEGTALSIRWGGTRPARFMQGLIEDANLRPIRPGETAMDLERELEAHK